MGSTSSVQSIGSQRALEGGSSVSVDLVMLFVAEGADIDAVARAAALSEGGEVVGGIDALRGRQLRLPTRTLDELDLAVSRLLRRDGVEDVLFDVYLAPEGG